MVVRQGEDVGNHQADHDQGLQGYQAPQVINLGEGVSAGIVPVTEIMENHHNNHEDCIANREDIKRCTTNVLSPSIELQIALQPGLVVVVVEKLVYDQEGCPVNTMAVDENGEGSEGVGDIAVIVIEGGEGEHEDYLANTEDYLGDGSTESWQLLELGTLLRANKEL